MGRRNVDREELGRLEAKTLDARFLTTIEHGLNCSPFEAEAVLQVVKEVFTGYFDAEAAVVIPGKLGLVVVGADEPSGKPIRECEKVTVALSVHRGIEDDRLLQQQGPDEFRRARIPDLCQEALSQGGLLTREDLARRIFFVGLRTISRDLAELRKQDIPVPLRSVKHDIGPVLTHRVQIVRLALEGKTTTEICQIMHHSADAVANYLATFARCAQLAKKNLDAGQIAFVLHRGRGLIRQYLELFEQCQSEPVFTYHLNELLLWGGEGKKKGVHPRIRRVPGVDR